MLLRLEVVMPTYAKVVSKSLWLLVSVAAIGAAALLTLGIVVGSMSAPQQGAAGAIAAAVGVLPYVLARSWDELFRA